MVESSTAICWMNPFVILGVAGLFCRFYDGDFVLLASNVDPDQTSKDVVSDLGLHCLHMNL